MGFSRYVLYTLLYSTPDTNVFPIDDENQYARSHAVEYVDGLDRSALGTLAVDTDFLVLIMTRCTLNKDSRTNADHLLDRKAALACEAAGLSIPRVEAEVLLWCGEHNTRLMDGGMTQSHTEWLNRLQLVLDSGSAFLPYFEVGIWDATVVASFVSDGIDPQIALSMLSSSVGNS